ncbi:MAG: hypothetical protein Q8N18_13085 [Opitutaceae bacterium]|nr:hypothetical protein [Opitutaceae bacterium]
MKTPDIPELAGTFPVVLYFGSDADRAEFIEIVKEAKPGLIARPLDPEGGILGTGKDVTAEMAPAIERILETAAANWKRKHMMPHGDSPEGHDEAMIADEAADAMRNLPLVSPNSVIGTRSDSAGSRRSLGSVKWSQIADGEAGALVCCGATGARVRLFAVVRHPAKALLAA